MWRPKDALEECSGDVRERRSMPCFYRHWGISPLRIDACICAETHTCSRDTHVLMQVYTQKHVYIDTLMYLYM